MNAQKFLSVAVAVLALDIQASGDTWLLSKLETTTADSAETNAIYGYQAVANDASQVTVNVTDGAINLVASKIASDSTEGYSANVGLILPLTPDWAEHDLTGLTSITFEFQNDTKITDVLSVSFGSNAYSEAIAKAGTVFSNDIAGVAALAAGTTWKQGEVLLADFATPSWWTPIPSDFPSLDTVLKHVENLQFAPKTMYSASGSQNGTACTKCVTPTMPNLTLKIRNIVLHGSEPPLPPPMFIGCDETRPKFQLDDFAKGSKNRLGGDWFAYSDFDSTGRSTDLSAGSSLVSDRIDAEGADLALSAQLRKKVGETYHKYAGWAGIGTRFGEGKTWDATGVTGFGFQLIDKGSNAELVQNLAFKVKMKGVSDTAVHQVNLPLAELVKAGTAGKLACIRPSDLAQASYIAAGQKVAFQLDSIEQLSWEVRITDDRSSAHDTASANFLLSNVWVYGVDPAQVGIHPAARAKTSAAYANGRLQLDGFDGANQFQVRRLDGTLLASFGTHRGTAIALPRGTYLLSATGAKQYSSKFAVLGR